MSSSSLSKLLTAPRALFLRYTILPCSAPQAFSLSATRVTQYEYTHLFLFHIVCSVSADSVTVGAVERDRRLSPFITVISGVASRRVASGLAHFRANVMHVCRRPNIFSSSFTRPLDLKSSCVSEICRLPLLLSHAPTKGRLIGGELGQRAGRRAGRARMCLQHNNPLAV